MIRCHIVWRRPTSIIPSRAFGAVLLSALSCFGSASSVIPYQPSILALDGQKLVSNSFQDTDLKQALSDLGLSAGVSIVPDDSVTGNVTATIKNKTIEQALDIMVLPGGFSWTRIGESYLVGKAEPTSPNYLKLAASRIYRPNYSTPDKIVSLLPTVMGAYVKASPGERTITITAAPMMMDRILHDLRMLDIPSARVQIEAIVTEVATSTLNSYDLSFNWKHFSMADSVSTPSTSFQYTQVTANDMVTLTNLINRGLATIKASPRVMTIEGKEASIEVGQENYFEVISGPVSYPVATVQLIKTGISLKLTPFVSEDGTVTVTLNPEVSDATGSGANGLPINTVRRASTTVRVKDGETIAIGGMTYENKRRSDNKLPILGDLPLIGSFFRSHSDLKSKQDVIILITPKVIPDGLIPKNDLSAAFVPASSSPESVGTSEIETKSVISKDLTSGPKDAPKSDTGHSERETKLKAVPAATETKPKAVPSATETKSPIPGKDVDARTNKEDLQKESTPPQFTKPVNLPPDQPKVPWPKTKLNLNQATLEQMSDFPGVGPLNAGQIFTYRKTHGAFRSLDDLNNVPHLPAGLLVAAPHLFELTDSKKNKSLSGPKSIKGTKAGAKSPKVREVPKNTSHQEKKKADKKKVFLRDHHINVFDPVPNMLRIGASGTSLGFLTSGKSDVSFNVPRENIV